MVKKTLKTKAAKEDAEILERYKSSPELFETTKM
jgi:hypothetical protein